MNKKNLTRKNLSNKIYKTLGFSKNFSSKVVDNLFETLVGALLRSDKIKISSFGTFTVMNKKERMGRNPKTKIEAKIKSRKVVNFKPAFVFREKINS